jgi:hypothetical protein
MASDTPLQKRSKIPSLAKQAGLPRNLSRYERDLGGRKLSPWTRGLHFTWIWTDLGLPWNWYEQFWFFRGTRDWYVLFVPYFWRNTEEFFDFEKKFIKAATTRHGRISEQEFIRRAEAVKTELNLSAIQAILLPAAKLRYGGAVAKAAGAIDLTGDVKKWWDTAKCLVDGDACRDAMYSWALSTTKGRLLKAK